MFSFFQTKPLLDETSIEWMHATFTWASEQFGESFFQEDTQLILPNDRFFPGRADSYQAMAELIFGHVKKHAGMTHWHFELIPNTACLPEHLEQQALDSQNIPTPLRSTQSLPTVSGKPLPVIYDPSQVNNPSAMIAGFAHALAHYLGTQTTVAPPGGTENWPHITELLAVYMGFGLMFANSAYTSPKSCASCSNTGNKREAYLSQFDITYALAIFAAKKDLTAKQVRPYLNKPLQGFFKHALKEAQTNPMAAISHQPHNEIQSSHK